MLYDTDLPSSSLSAITALSALTDLQIGLSDCDDLQPLAQLPALQVGGAAGCRHALSLSNEQLMWLAALRTRAWHLSASLQLWSLSPTLSFC